MSECIACRRDDHKNHNTGEGKIAHVICTCIPCLIDERAVLKGKVESAESRAQQEAERAERAEAEVAEWKRVAGEQAKLHDEDTRKAEADKSALREALEDLAEDAEKLFYSVNEHCQKMGHAPIELTVYKGWARMKDSLPKAKQALQSPVQDKGEVQKACDACTQGVMDATNDHLHGRCGCKCHREGV